MYVNTSKSFSHEKNFGIFSIKKIKEEFFYKNVEISTFLGFL